MMTLKVYRVQADGERELVSEEEYDPGPLGAMPAGEIFPPCSCPDCRLKCGAR